MGPRDYSGPWAWPFLKRGRRMYRDDSSNTGPLSIGASKAEASSVVASIIIVTYNCSQFIQRCVASVLEHTQGLPVELIFVDNASSDGTAALLNGLPQTKVVVNTDNRGFAAACNQGLRLAKGDFLVLLNPDTVVTEGWLQRLIATAERHADVGAVGPRSNQTGELQHDAAAESQYGNLEEMQAYAKRIAAYYKGEAIEFHRLSGFCLLLKREVVKRVGELDEQFELGFYEDDDYCKRIRGAGYRLLIALDVFIHHEGGASFSSLAPGFASQLMIMNRQRYLAKWAEGSWYTKMPSVNSSEPAVSIIIVTRNRPHLLREAITSALSQTFNSFELLVVNDDEQDLGPVIEDFADERVRLIRSPGRGKPCGLNAALDAARAQFIAYLDDDDRYYPWHLETLVCALMNRPNHLLAYTDTVVGYCFPLDGGHHVGISHRFTPWEYNRSQLLEQNYIPNIAVMHHRRLLEQAGRYDERLSLYEDWDILRRFSYYTDFLHVPVITAEWHRHPNRPSRNEPAAEDVSLKTDVQTYIASKPSPEMWEPTVYDLVRAAIDAEASGFFQIAASTYLSALHVDPFCYDAALGAARVLKLIGWHHRVRPLLRQAIVSRPDHHDAFLAYAEALLSQELSTSRPSKQDVLEAKEALEFALLVDSGDETGIVYQLLAKCYRRLGLGDTAGSCVAYSHKFRPPGIVQQSSLRNMRRNIRKFRYLWRTEGFRVSTGKALRVLYGAIPHGL